MITGELKSKVDQIWNAFWSGGITNSLTVIEQLDALEKEIQADLKALRGILQ